MSNEPAAASHANGGTKKTVLIAGAANLVVALIKAVAGVLTSSSAMLAESAHSVADNLNQALVLTSIERVSKRADAEHPFGRLHERVPEVSHVFIDPTLREDERRARAAKRAAALREAAMRDAAMRDAAGPAHPGA